MTRLWLSPGLPADPADVAAAYAADGTVLPLTPLPPPDSLAVVGAPETELLRSMATRPADVRLLVVTPPGAVLPDDMAAAARPDLVAPASSVGELLTLVRSMDVPGPAAAPAGAWWSAPAVPADAGGQRRPWNEAWAGRSRRTQVAAGAVAVVAILGIVLGITLTSGGSSADAAAGRGNGVPGGQGFGGFGGQGGSGRQGGDTMRQEIEKCLAEKGIEVGSGSLRSDLSDPAVRTAVEACLSTLNGGQGFGGPGGQGFGGQVPNGQLPGGQTAPGGTQGTTRETALTADSQLRPRAHAAVVATLRA